MFSSELRFSSATTARWLIVTLFFVSVSGVGCKRKASLSDLPASIGTYVYAFTTGVISKTAPIRVQFAMPAVLAEEVGKEAKNILSFSPSLAGQAVWEDVQTIAFTPANEMPSGKTYTATVNLRSVFKDAPSDASSFDFDFQIRRQALDVSITGLETPNEQDPSKQVLSGHVQTADVADIKEVEKVLTATQGSNTLPIQWTQDDSRTRHRFRIRNIARSNNNDSQVKLAWNGKNLDVSEKGSKTWEVPRRGNFKVLDGKPIQDGDQQYLQFIFSDPLEAGQNLQGLLGINGSFEDVKTLIDGHMLRVYPERNMSGTQKITFSPGIRNAWGDAMASPSVWDVEFSSQAPQVRLLGEGVVIPTSEGLIFPFEAVSLHAVEVEIFKIYNNNVLQFLQTNTLDSDDYQMYRVGNIVYRKRINLNTLSPETQTSKNKGWTRYALDLSNMVGKDPQAIYQVRLGFRKEYSTHFCGGNDKNAGLTTLESASFSEEDMNEENSIMNWWYGPTGYYENYWNEQSNPCKDAYFYRDRFVQRNVLASNLGLVVKGSDNNQYTGIVTDLRTTKTMSGVELTFYDYAQQPVGTGKTGNDGTATIKTTKKPFFLVAKQGKETGYLRLEDGNALSMSRYDVDGASASKGMKGYFYGERDVWRPGDSIFLHFVLESKANPLPAKYPVSMEWYDPRGQLHDRRSVVAPGESIIYPLHIKTPSDATTGNWSVKVKAGGAEFTRVVKIETIKPNRLAIALDVPKTGLQQNTSFPLNVRWLHGASAGGLKAEVDVLVKQDYEATYSGFKGFVFQDQVNKMDGFFEAVFSGNLDGQGRANLKLPENLGKNAPGKLSLFFMNKVFEEGGNFSTSSQRVGFDPYPHYAGVRIPANKYGEKQLDVQKEANLELAAVGTDGKPMSGKKLQVGLYRMEWRWWWEEGHENLSQFSSGTHANALKKQTLVTNGKGIANWRVTPDTWGRYLVRVCDEETGHCSSDFFYAGYPWYGDDDMSPEARQGAAMVALTTNKPRYAVGETVQLTVPASVAGRALISLENASGVVKTMWEDVKSGENTFRFKAEEGMAPNIYAHITIMQPHNQQNNDLPIRLYGVLPVLIEDPATRLQPQVAMPAELEPEQSYSVQVSEKSGKAMSYTLAIVDEGLLGITGFKTPNPWESFYAKEALGVRTWDIYDYVIGAYGGKIENVLGIGGDVGLADALNPDAANRFEPVVRHLGPFYLKKGQTAKHALKMPNYAGAVRVMVVAAGNNAYGSAEKKVPVRKPLMILPTLPRVLSPGETVYLPVNVFTGKDQIKNVQLSASEGSGLATLESNSQSLTFSRTGSQTGTFRVKVGEREGVAKFVVKASGGGYNASQTIEIQVRNPNPMITRSQFAMVEPGQAWSGSYQPIGIPGTNSTQLELSVLPPLNLSKQLDYLLQYPYGCIEQTISTGFPQLHLAKLIDLSPEQKKQIPQNIEASIERIKQFQTGAGGFGYWPGDEYADHWGSSYAGHFLLEAKEAGYTVPQSLVDRWVSFQQKTAKAWDPRYSDAGWSPASQELTQAYRLYTLALAQKAEQGAMNRLRERPNLSQAAAWRLAAAYVLTGKKDIALALIKDKSTQIEPYRELSYSYGSSLRDHAMILETLVYLKDMNRAGQQAKDLADAMSNRSWMSTQETGYGLLALSKFVGNREGNNKLSATYTLAGKSSVNAGSNKPVMQIELPAAGNSLQVKNTTQGPLFVRIVQHGKPSTTQAQEAASENLKMAISYTDLKGKPINPASIRQGTSFLAEVRITHPGDRQMPFKELALNQVFPAGWEIINSRVTGGSYAKSGSPFDYQDFRDDRVNTFFDISPGKTQVYQVQLTASYAGRFYMPLTSCEAMYDNSIYARIPGQWVEVTM